MASRLERLRQALREKSFEAAYVSYLPNVRYLAGFTGTEGSLLVTADTALFFTDSRYTDQAGKQVTPHGFKVVQFQKKLEEIGVKVQELGIAQLGIEDKAMTVAMHRDFATHLGEVKATPLGGLVTNLRVIKDEAEQEKIRRAVQVQEQAMEKILPMIVPGAVERDIAFELETEMRRLGATSPSFDTIVGSGPRGAMPHGVASDKEIAAGELVVLDWGCVVDGYCSDQTLTVAVGEAADPEAHKVYDIVYKAQRQCIESIRPGMAMKEIDKVARDVITEAGYGKLFGHGTGHSLGLEIHEDPRASMLGEGNAQIGMVFTVEPGIYLSGRFGVRLEDIVVVTQTGAECLTTMSKKWRSTL
ncbi:MAG: Xaa-Pro peptidase family protein [Candidatus Lernaella stagnicola]|nr:Xaa-Pro peptidase family protein [Candidatus Lernaella stagnicola]